MSTRTLKLEWKGYYDYTWENVHKYAPNRSGVYKIGIMKKNNTYAVRYVGQANDIDRRLKEHLDLDNEPNECLQERLRKYQAGFSFAEVSAQSDRDGAERALYYHYRPVCNDEGAIPSEPEIHIDFR